MARLRYKPLTPDLWSDFEALFGPRGAYSGCWCMYWRVSRAEFARNGNAGNKRAMRKVVRTGGVPGILLYEKGQAIAWCSVAPREQFDSLNRSRVLKAIDDTPVWSIVCFFVDKEHRGRGTLARLIEAATDYARRRGAKVVEAYPSVVKNEKLPPVSSYMGLPDALARAGFVEVARPSASKRIMRYEL